MTAKERVASLLAQNKKQSEIAAELGVSAARVSQLVKEIRAGQGEVKPKGKASAGASRKPKEGMPKTNRRPPPPGPHSTGFKPGNPGGPGAPKGNENAVTTGENVNPFLRALFPKADQRIIAETDPPDAATAVRRSISLYSARLQLQLLRLAKLEAEKKQMITVESSYTRQEGDGELMGTGRIATRKRRSIDEEIRRQSAIIDRTQRLHDQAVKLLIELEKGAPPPDDAAGNKQYADALNAKAPEVWADEEADDGSAES
jgi:uncharacterized protein YjcR